MDLAEDIFRVMVANGSCVDLSGDTSNSGINMIDRREQRYYKITDEQGAARIIESLDQPINAPSRNQGRFVERSYERISGMNIHVDEDTIRTGRLSDLCVFIYTELRAIAEIPVPIRFYFTYNYLTIPKLRMSFKSRIIFVEKLRRKCANTPIKMHIDFYNIITHPTMIYEVQLNAFGNAMVTEILGAGDEIKRTELMRTFKCSSMSIYLRAPDEISVELPDEPVTIPPLENRDINIQTSTTIPEVYFAHELVRLIESTNPQFFADNIAEIVSCLIPRRNNFFYKGQYARDLTHEFNTLIDYTIRSYTSVGEFTGCLGEAIKNSIMTRFTTTSVANLVFWCQAFDKSRYNVILEEYVHRKLRQFARLEEATDHDKAHVMFFMGCHRYGVQSIFDGSGRLQHVWYEFVDGNNGDGHAYKWQVVQAKNVMIMYFLQQLRGSVNSLAMKYGQLLNIDEKVRRPRGDFLEEGGWFDQMILDTNLTQEQLRVICTRLQRTHKELGNLSHNSKFVDILTAYFDRTEFFNRLNSDSYLIGTRTGVLELMRPGGVGEMRLIQRFHSHAVSWSAGGTLIDRESAAVKMLIEQWNSYFVEDGVGDWILMFLSQSMDASTKAAMMLVWAAPGARAKTFWSELTMNALGLSEGGAEDGYMSGYATKVNNMLFTDEGRSAHGHTTAIAKLDRKRAGVLSEGPRDKPFASHVLKMLLGQETQSGRQINERERNIRINLMLWYVANFHPKLDSVDYGTRRRIITYTPKYTYLENPDPMNPLQRKADPRFSKSLKDQQEYKDAWLTILAHTHCRLQREYGGDMERAPMPEALRKETSEFIYTNDTVYQFAVENLVLQTNFVRTDPEMRKKYVITDTEVKNRFADWFQAKLQQQRSSYVAGLGAWSDSFLGRWIVRTTYGEFTLEGLAFINRDMNGEITLNAGERRFELDEWRNV